ncbi:MAG: efflux RND transporter periplasmic adaptor subunit [Leptolinea sp.]
MSNQNVTDQIMNVFKKLRTKSLIIGGIILVLLALGSLVLIQIRSSNNSGTKATKAVVTSEVRLGDITVEISGTGNIVAPHAIDLAFSTNGKIAELNVNPGKSVIEGDVLAKLDRITSLQMDVDNKNLALKIADKTLADLETNKEINLANALIAQSSAAAALETAHLNEVNKYSPRCEKNVTEQYYFDYMYARHDYLYWYNALIKKSTGYGDMYIQERMAPYFKTMKLNYSNWKYCEVYSDLEIKQSQGTVEKAESDYQKAKLYYETLKYTGGIDPEELALAQGTQKNAELQYKEAQRTLDGATLTSPMDGTILTVAAVVGETLDKDTYKSSFIKIADLSQPMLQANFDETDLSSLNADCAVQATFASLANTTYKGSITQIDPALVITNNVTTVQTTISLEGAQTSKKMNLPIGLSATIDLTCAIAKNVLVVPLQALKKESDGKAQVYIMNSDGTIKAHTVEVGAKSASYAEIIGDINVGDVVVTSAV